MNLERYECEKLAETLLRITFKGAQFGKYVCTEYLAELKSNMGKTEITMRFQREGIGLLPTTSAYQLDIFMEQKVHGARAREIEAE